ncbi:MAG: hypothetical protein L0229_19125 [Blastocatellia bacterium]|nr:hypothetical protein [Blastocatellia bacterium]
MSARRAELLSSVGAGVLGAGLALLFAQALAPYSIPILLVGLFAHAWGMFQKHKLESQTAITRIWWAEALYWACWLALVVLLLVIAVREL